MDVPCNGCTACCRWGDAPHLKPVGLQADANGDCVNLTDAGCAIHDNLPAVCDRFDCITILVTWPNNAPTRLVQAAADRLSRS